MIFRKKRIFFVSIITLGISIFLVSCSHHSMEGMVVFTRVPRDVFNTEKESVFFNFPGAQIVAIQPDKPIESEIVLTKDFYSACSPRVSYDGKRLLFIAQKTKEDTWQVWELNLAKKTSKKITDFKESCSGPAYLPGDHLVFSREMPDTGTGRVQALFTMKMDGCCISQITFHPHFDYPATILRDGRILMLSKQLFPKEGEMMFLAMRPNGTKAELFYKNQGSILAGSQSYESDEGLIYFIEQNTEGHKKTDIVSVYQNRPLFTKVNYTSGIEGSFYSALPFPSGDMLVSYQPVGDQTIHLYHFSVKMKSLGELILSDSEYDLLEPVLIHSYKRPRKLPNDLNMEKSSGLLLCQNINLTSVSDTNSSLSLKATKIEILGIDKSFGIVPVEKDGSFYLKVKADTPIRIMTFNDDDQVVSGPSDWLWVRPFERRGCVGCHEDSELAPENIVPLAINKWPVLVPVDTSQAEKVKTTSVSEMK